jgi:Protein of unknown function (DUF2797)
MQGRLGKMKSRIENNVIHYQINMDNNEVVKVNNLIGKNISIIFLNKISCINCNKVTKKSWGEGLCYNCYMTSSAAAPCILRPELCEAHIGKGRDIDWENNHHNQPHVVYLALTNQIKVGVTRETQIPTRWIDQGAWQAVVFAIVPYRQLAGKIEVELKQFLSDKTDWRKMLTNQTGNQNILAVKTQMGNFLSQEFCQYISNDESIFELKYPVEKYPESVTSSSLDKTEKIEGILTGVRGQYFYINGSTVFNVRSHSGYHVELTL